MYVQFGANGAGTCKAKACKLEEGEIQTLGWKDSSGSVHLFETSNYGAELAQCQEISYCKQLKTKNRERRIQTLLACLQFQLLCK